MSVAGGVFDTETGRRTAVAKSFLPARPGLRRWRSRNADARRVTRKPEWAVDRVRCDTTWWTRRPGGIYTSARRTRPAGVRDRRPRGFSGRKGPAGLCGARKAVARNFIGFKRLRTSNFQSYSTIFRGNNSNEVNAEKKKHDTLTISA